MPRKGEINAWENEDFVRAVRGTGKRTLLIAGVWTSICVVYAVMDASGDPSEFASRVTLARFTQAGVVPTSANAVMCEFQRHWNRPNNAPWAELYTMVAPDYAAVIESYRKAQESVKHATA